MKKLTPILAAVSLSLAGSAFADLSSIINPFDNATVRAAGPRSGTSGKGFFNVEGDANAANASYGVLDFDASLLGISPGSVGGVTSLTLTLVESNAVFTAPGPLAFYLSADTTTSIQPTNTDLKYVSPSADNNGGAGTNLTPLYLLGTGNFTTTGNVNNGTSDVYTLDLTGFSGAGLTYLLDTLNAGQTLRFVITPEATTTAATWGGYTSTSGYFPSLQVDYVAVPEPKVVALLAAGGGMLLWLRKGRRFQS